MQTGGYGVVYNDAWGHPEPESGDEGDSLAKIDRALAMEVNIPLDHKGELVSFREVRQWQLPSLEELQRLKERINEEWIKPLSLKQQDIVKASGLGAPYVCYLLKDPNSPNMNRRRKIEAYSVLSELFRKFDSKVVTKDDFIRLRNQRIANRSQGPRLDRQKNGAKGASGPGLRNRPVGSTRIRSGPYDDDDDDDDHGGPGSGVGGEDDYYAGKGRRPVPPMPGRGRAGPGPPLYGHHLGHADRMQPGTGAGAYLTHAGQAAFPQPGPYAAPVYGPPDPYAAAKVAAYPPYQPGSQAPPPTAAGAYSPHMLAAYTQPVPWLPSANVPVWPTHQYVYAMARGQRANDNGDMVDPAPGQTFTAPYPMGFPQVARSIVSLSSYAVDGPPPTQGPLKGGEKIDISTATATTVNGVAPIKATPTSNDSKYDEWVRGRVSQLAKTTWIPRTEGGVPVIREPTIHSFVFLVDKKSTLLPIGVKVGGNVAHPAPPGRRSGGSSSSSGSGGGDWESENLYDVKMLRNDAEASDWLDEDHDWEDAIWILWEITETGATMQRLFDRWRHEHDLSERELHALRKSFLSQYIYLRDIELGFQALQPYSLTPEEFFREIEINCDLLEERIRVKDAFMWDIRAKDWDLTALLSNFVSDFQLDSPAMSSLFIDLKTTILRHRKEWTRRTLERLTAEGKIDPTRFLSAVTAEVPSALQGHHAGARQCREMTVERGMILAADSKGGNRSAEEEVGRTVAFR